MTFLAIVFFYLALLVSSTFAILPLPEGYHIVHVTAFRDNLATDESWGNPDTPLLNATLTCYKDNQALWLWRNYELWGSGWYGVSEESIKDAAAHSNAAMTKWKFETWNTTHCDEDAEGPEDCIYDYPVWHAKFRHSMIMGSQDVMMLESEKLAGLWSRNWKQPAQWLMSNGTHERMGNLTEAYPPRGHMFERICQWTSL